MAPASTTPSDDFIQQLTGSQTSLRAMILASLGNHADCQDVLQKTNLVIWKKASEYDPEREFLAWAFGIARFEVLAFIRDRQRERLMFREDVAELLAAVVEAQAESISHRQMALRDCLRELPAQSRKLLDFKYVRGNTTQQISEETGRSIDGVKSVLLRIRKLLGDCVKQRIEAMPE